MQQFHKLLLDVYVWLNMFRTPLRPSSEAYNCNSSLWFYRWSVVVVALLVNLFEFELKTYFNTTSI
jgi:glucan phosphoethanolaminetransferase (alkaline phosphatase superfamily)